MSDRECPCLTVRPGGSVASGDRSVYGTAGAGTVLALPQIWVSALWISCLAPASIERQVTGMAGTAGHRRSR